MTRIPDPENPGEFLIECDECGNQNCEGEPRCGYCGERAATVDHILPISRGGRNTWTNTVAACHGCNARKANHTPSEAGMPLRQKPFAPSRSQLMVPERLTEERAA